MTPGKTSVKYTLKLMYLNRVLTGGLSQYKYKCIKFMRVYVFITFHSHYSFVLDHAKIICFFKTHG